MTQCVSKAVNHKLVFMDEYSHQNQNSLSPGPGRRSQAGQGPLHCFLSIGSFIYEMG